MNKVETGMKVYLKPVNNMARYNKEIKEVVIQKVGRKYFEVGFEGHDKPFAKFNIDDFAEATNYAPDWKLYFSKQDILDEEEFENLHWQIRDKFDPFRKSELTLEKLRKINEILESE